VIHCCCLEEDIRTMLHGEHTQIGENGTTLSGGQQQRISLARAVYREADTYLFDDVLSALDAAVGQTVFKRLLSKHG
jgi:ABC-type multidrug transport system fused ATPase/permease subunit